MSHPLKHLLLTLLLFFACFGGPGVSAAPASSDAGKEHGAGIAQGQVHTWPAVLPELERLQAGQPPAAAPHKKQSTTGLGAPSAAIEHWLQHSVTRRIAFRRFCQVGLTSTRLIFPFHYFW